MTAKASWDGTREEVTYYVTLPGASTSCTPTRLPIGKTPPECTYELCPSTKPWALGRSSHMCRWCCEDWPAGCALDRVFCIYFCDVKAIIKFPVCVNAEAWSPYHLAASELYHLLCSDLKTKNILMTRSGVAKIGGKYKHMSLRYA